MVASCKLELKAIGDGMFLVGSTTKWKQWVFSSINGTELFVWLLTHSLPNSEFTKWAGKEKLFGGGYKNGPSCYKWLFLTMANGLEEYDFFIR